MGGPDEYLIHVSDYRTDYVCMCSEEFNELSNNILILEPYILWLTQLRRSDVLSSEGKSQCSKLCQSLEHYVPSTVSLAH
jgi:hypothetical protein